MPQHVVRVGPPVTQQAVEILADEEAYAQWYLLTLMKYQTEGDPKTPCDLAPYGYRCSRGKGHSGPCAAHPTDGRCPF